MRNEHRKKNIIEILGECQQSNNKDILLIEMFEPSQHLASIGIFPRFKLGFLSTNITVIT